MPSHLKHRVHLFAALLAAGALVAGCSSDDDGGSSTQAATSGDSLDAGSGPTAKAMTVNMLTPPHSLDPGDQCNLADGIASNFYSNLVKFGKKKAPNGTLQTDQTKFEPDLAESWDVSKDGKVYTFHLRRNARFSNGDKVDADAVVYTFNRVVDMGVCSSYGVETSDSGVVKSIEAIDPETVRITLKHPNKSLLKSWATPSLGIVNPKTVDANGGVQKGKPNEYLATNVVGSGPYVLDSYVPNEKLVMTANPDYFGEKPKTERVEVNFVSSPTTLQLQARNGTADITYGLAKQLVDSLKSDDNKVLSYTGTGTEQVVMNWKKPPFDNPKFREALLAAIPYDQLVDKVAYGFGSTFYGPILPSMPYYDEAGSKAIATDLEKAKQLLKESGVKTPVTVTLTSDAGNSVHSQLATVLKDAWGQLGVDVKVDELDQATYTDALFGNKGQAIIRRDGPFVNDPSYYLGYDMSCKVGGNPNPGNICIPEADKLQLEATTALDEDVRKRDFADVTKLWREQFPKAFLYLDEDVVVTSPDVSDFQFDVGFGALGEAAKQSS